MISNRNYNKIRRNTILYSCARVLGTIYFSFFYRLNVLGREYIPARGPLIVLPKHQRWIDIPVVGLAVQTPCHYIAKKELFEKPIVRNLMVGLGGIALDRQHPVRSLNSFRYLDFLLMVGEIIVLFPEGTYFPDTMGDGKFKMIERILMVHERLKNTTKTTSIPFMPIGIRYGKKLLRPDITVTIGNALHCPEGMSAQEFTKQIMSAIRALSGLP